MSGHNLGDNRCPLSRSVLTLMSGDVWVLALRFALRVWLFACLFAFAVFALALFVLLFILISFCLICTLVLSKSKNIIKSTSPLDRT